MGDGVVLLFHGRSLPGGLLILFRERGLFGLQSVGGYRHRPYGYCGMMCAVRPRPPAPPRRTWPVDPRTRRIEDKRQAERDKQDKKDMEKEDE